MTYFISNAISVNAKRLRKMTWSDIMCAGVCACFNLLAATDHCGVEWKQGGKFVSGGPKTVISDSVPVVHDGHQVSKHGA